jgi:hypothetical protein
LNVGNIFINRRPDANHRSDNSIDLALIDFGQAGPSSQINLAEENYSCDKIKRISNRLLTRPLTSFEPSSTRFFPLKTFG